MLSSLASTLGPLHLLTYSTLLGTEMYQTFVMTKVAHQELPRSAFTTLQKRLFPLYFRGQSLLVVLAAATVPPHGPISLFEEQKTWIPFAVAGLTSALNLLVYGPRTRQVMIDRIHQGTREDLKARDMKGVSAEMRQLNQAFSRNHAMSIHLNLVTIRATLWYGWKLASMLNFDITRLD
ncbi:uncharacterized protein BDR25DRAFT_371780 [Lindgomyces ingoldianus]|uniref:Uncharacterized protein n=1 Tax=Lindgomyces ingoldianus TaxID=673940 RepID=A0ACB6QSG4_9PLEO|nr:uncharacterized protein BDR25DRAFT_371780 [Lindgomyces ingoldianus]KAF2469242.1 hypothetical protein BDR25DRAFT_371780 [Lindgomyces ingoldianus]